MLFLHYVIKKLVCLAADFKRGSMKNTQTSEEERIYGELYERDSRFVASCRKLQSIYRVEIGEPICPYIDSHNKVHRYGNYIGLGDISGKNFLEKYIFDYANKRVEKKKEYETISSTRLYNNLLSSQPMAFNLFCPLRQMLIDLPEEATHVIRAALPMYPICKATEVELEFIPPNYKGLTNDKSAMDAIIRYEDPDGRPGFIAIETKYSENLGMNEASENGKERSREIIRSLGCFRPDVEERIVAGKIRLTQIYRNFLLSESYGADKGYASYSLVLAPERHPSTDKEVNSLADELLPEFRDKIRSMSLEEFAGSLIRNSPSGFRETFEKFWDRYLNFGKLNDIP